MMPPAAARHRRPSVTALARGAPRARGPDVLILTIDTLRADAAGRGKGTPAIEAFLDEATHFTGARTVVPLTLPAHVTLFSGLLPAGHGVHDNAVSPFTAGRGFPLLAEEFRDAGYATAAYVAADVVGPDTGIDAGFETFGALESPAHRAAFAYPQASFRVEAPLRWLKERTADRPFFLWVHFFDAHWPYNAFPGDERRAPTRASDSPRARYDGEVRRVDAAVERLLHAVPKEAVVVIASDHGEAFLEHGEFGHGRLCYGTTLDILLAVRGPGLEGGRVDTSPRGLCDVAPTLREWCNLSPRPHDGAPLTGPPLPAVVSESLFGWRAHGWGQCLAASDGRFTLVESGPRLELFDRESDPGENRPLDPEGHEAYEHLDRAIQELRSRSAAREDPGLIPEVILPYGSGRRPVKGYLPRDHNARLVDPVARAGYAARLDRLIFRQRLSRANRDVEDLIKIVAGLRRLADEDPGDPAPRFQLALA
ncbi:MAG: sulfatase, partial [Planctomycetota bacterium]